MKAVTLGTKSQSRLRVVVSHSLLFMGLALSTFLQAAELRQISFPDKTSVAGQSLSLNGLGLRIVNVFGLHFEAYVGALYLESKTSDAEKILSSTTLKKIRLVFLRSVSAWRMRTVIEDGFEKNCEPHCDELKESLKKLKSFMEEAKTGDSQDYVFFEDHIEFFFRDQKKGEIAAPHVSRIILSSWLGPKPPNPELRNGMLGLAP